MTRKGNKGIPSRTPAQLRGSVYHITYEREGMLRAGAKFRQTEGRFPLEAALVHARNLIDFCWTPTNKRRAHPDGVYAANFFKPGVWKTRIRAVPSRPSQLYEALSAQLVHISVKRNHRDVIVDFTEERVDRLLRDLEAVWRLFLECLANTQWHDRIQRRAAKWSQVK